MRTPDFFQLQRDARRRSIILIGGSFLILAVVANVVAAPFHLRESCAPGTFGFEDCSYGFGFSPGAALLAMAVVAGYMLIAYLASAKAALKLAGAREATGPEYQQLRNIVEEMTLASGTPLPKVYVVDDPSPNAFATGRKPERAAVTVTTGLLRQMSRRELTGVVAHELAHIRNRDIAVTTVAVLTAGTIAVLADVAMRMAWVLGRSSGRRSGNSKGSGGIAIVLLALAVLLYVIALPAALLLRAALSRQRESLADFSAVQYTRDPSGIRSALEKLEADTSSPTRVSTATAHLWIDEPKPAGRPQRRILSGLFDTHPPIDERIAILRRMEGLDPTGRGPNDLPPPPPPIPTRSYS